MKTSGISSKVDARFYVMSGPRRNITAAAKTGATIETSLLPDETVAIQATFRYRKLDVRPRSTLILRTLSGYQPANQDANRVLLRAR